MYRAHKGKKNDRKRRRLLAAMLIVACLAVGGTYVYSHKHQAKPVAKAAVKSPDTKVANKPAAAQAGQRVLFSQPMNGPDRIVTNEFAHFSPGDNCPYNSSVWDMTSGTLLIKNGAGYSGVPTVEKNSVCQSATHNNSAIFRLNTKEDDFKNIKVSMDFMPVAHGGGGAPDNSYDGIHIWVGYQSEYALYAATIFRWDNVTVIKKKVPASQTHCSDVSNDGCYFNLTKESQNPETPRAWHHTEVTDSVDGNGTVHLTLSVDGRQLASGTDDRVGGASAYPSGAVGVRGDNTEFYFKNFQVTQL